MTQTSSFHNNRTQAVRLPKDVAFPENVREVNIHAVGSTRILVPAGTDRDAWFREGIPVTDDFCAGREQPPMQERDWIG